jgi:hypothetical protein
MQLRLCGFATAIAAAAFGSASAQQIGWTGLVTAQAPAGRFGHALAYDSARQRAVLFGGLDATQIPRNDTWLWDGIDWAQAIALNPPPARAGHATAYDRARQRVVLFGGVSASGALLSDTWEWDGAAWRRALPAASPPARTDHVLAYDSSAQRILLFGGSDAAGALLADTWIWNGSTWTQVAAGAGPSARASAGIASDLGRRRVVLHGGADAQGRALADTWEWNGSAWQLATPLRAPRRAGHALAYDQARQRVLLFGGHPGSAETWQWDGSTWTQDFPLGQPTDRDGAALAFDERAQSVLLFGGFGMQSEPYLADTWSWGFAGHMAVITTFGLGCGLGVPLSLQPAPGSTPGLGENLLLDIDGGPPNAQLGYMSFGSSRTQVGRAPLPFDLRFFGAPGCYLYESNEVNHLTFPMALGRGQYTVPIPADTGLLGRAFFAQAFVPHLAANPLGLIASNATAAVIGMQPPVTLVQSDFTGAAPGVATPWTKTATLSASLGFGGWVRGSGVHGSSAVSNAFGFALTAGGATLTSLADAVAQGHYVSATLTPLAGALDLRGVQLSFTMQRLAYHAPLSYAVMTSAEGFAAGRELFASPPTANDDYTAHPWSLTLSGPGYASVTQPLEIRIYGYQARYGGHDTSLTDFRMVGGLPTYRLTLQAGSGGTVTATPSKSGYAPNDVVQVSAAAAPGYRFAGWSGDLRGGGNPGAVVMTRDKTVVADFAPQPNRMQLGVNLDPLVDWSTSWPFVDVFRRARAWMTHNADGTGAWSTGYESEIPVDADGWPTAVPFVPAPGVPPQSVHTVLVRVNEPGGYVFNYQGSGQLAFQIDSGPVQNLPTGGTRSFAFTMSTAGTIAVEIRSTAPPPNHLRGFEIVQQQYVSTYRTQPFHPLFLQRLAGFTVLRFMDWGTTNGSPLVSWSQRTRRTSYTQARPEGTSLECMVDLANTLRKDAWICIPHAADDDYVRRAAQLLRASLDPSLRLYVEYSNETWNSAGPFTQTSYVQDTGVALGLDTRGFEAGQKFVALRSAEIWKIFEDEFGAASSRVINVLATQSANPYVTQLRRDAFDDSAINPYRVFPEALALAPYFGRTYAPSEVPPYPTVSQLLDVVAPQTIQQVRTTVQQQKQIADAQGWQVICYEGGQHFVGIDGAENDPTLTQILHDANRDPRMYTRYVEYMNMLRSEGVEIFTHFSNCGDWSKWGAWSMLEYQDQPMTEAPKFRAVLDWMAAN